MLTKERIEQLRKEVPGTFSANTSRVQANTEYDFQRRTNAEITEDYAKELNRLNRLFDAHLQTITGDPSASGRNLKPLKTKVNNLQTIFCSMLDGKAKDDADELFSLLMQNVEMFAQMIRKPQPGEPYAAPSRNRLETALGHVGDCVLNLTGIAEDALKGKNPEAFDLCKDIISELRKVQIKNDPEHPAKDMLGITISGPINGVYSKVLAPQTVYTNMLSATKDNAFPKDAPEHDEFAKLDAMITGIKTRFSAKIAGVPGNEITEKDYVDVAKSMEHIIETYPVFADEMPNGFSDDRFRSPYPINGVFEAMKRELAGWKDVYPNIPEIVDISNTIQEKLDNRYKAEYEKLAEIAFSGDVTEPGAAKEAWQRMGSIKNMNDELQEIYSKDRLAMTMFSQGYCIQTVNNADKKIDNIIEKSDKISVSYTDRQPKKSSNEELNRRFNQVVEILKDSVALEVFSIGISQERGYEQLKKGSAARFSGGKSQKELDAFKAGYPKNREFALKRVDAFLKNLNKKLPGVDRDYYDAFDAELTAQKNPKLIENQLTKEEFKTIDFNDPKIQGVGIREIINRSIVKGLKKHAGELKQLYGAEVVLSKAQGGKEKLSMIQKCVSESNDNLNIDFRTAAAILGKGTESAVILRDDLISYRDSVKAGETPDANTVYKLYTSAQNYLHMKAGVPETTNGKKRVAAGQEILLKSAKALIATYEDNDVKEVIKNELRTEMIRSESFRSRMVKDALEVIEQAEKNHTLIEGHPEIEEAIETLSFASTVKSLYGDNQAALSKVKLDRSKNINSMSMVLDEVKEASAAKSAAVKAAVANGSYEAILSQARPVKAVKAKENVQQHQAAK